MLHFVHDNWASSPPPHSIQNCFGSEMQEIQDDLNAGTIVTSLVPIDLE